MSSPSPALASFEEAVAQLAGGDASQPWLNDVRAAGWQQFEQQGIPTARNERWKYTRLNALKRQQFTLPPLGGALSQAAHSGELSDLPGQRLVFVDGVLDETSSRFTEDAGVRVRSLGEAIASEDEVAKSLLGKIAQDSLHPFAALNSALFTSGVMIDVAPGTELQEPVYLLFISSRATSSLISSPRIALNIGANARLTVIEHHLAHEGASNLVNVTFEGRIGPGARLEYHLVQDGLGSDSQINGLHLEQARDSEVTHHSVSLGGRLIRNDLHSRLLGPGSRIDMRGLYLAGDRQHVDNHTLVEHVAGNTTSTQDYKGVLHGRGRAVFNGKVLIQEGASGSEAHQSNSNLLLSPNAEVDTKPELEIYNDDVKCSHGATVGQLDQQALFYLRSRGIGEETARIMLTFAFAESVLQGIPLASVRDRIEQSVIELLPASERIRAFV